MLRRQILQNYIMDATIQIRQMKQAYTRILTWRYRVFCIHNLLNIAADLFTETLRDNLTTVLHADLPQ